MATAARTDEVEILEALNAAERRELAQFMRGNRTLTVATALRALYEVFYVGNAAIVTCRDDVPFPPLALHVIRLPDDDDEALPF